MRGRCRRGNVFFRVAGERGPEPKRDGRRDLIHRRNKEQKLLESNEGPNGQRQRQE
jgi:hypothetical protein